MQARVGGGLLITSYNRHTKTGTTQAKATTIQPQASSEQQTQKQNFSNKINKKIKLISIERSK